MTRSPLPVETASAPSAPSTLSTDAGMLALWDPRRFTDIVDYDTWEPQLCEDEDVERHIRAGVFVPINIRCDGAYGVLVRIGSAGEPARLSERENRHRFVTSDAYLLHSSGEVRVSGIEAVGAEIWSGTIRRDLPEGRYAVVVHLIAWEDDPGSVNEDGTPSETALADFVVLIDPALPEQTEFRTAVETFDAPETDG